MNIFVTGGASGLGKAITENLCKDAENQIFFTFNNSKSNASQLEAQYPNANGIQCDFGSDDGLSSLKHSMEENEINVLINNAYHADMTPTHFHRMSAERFATDFENNIIPTIEITLTALKFFRKAKYGKVITVLTSYLAGTPPAGLAPYLANKAYLKKLSQVWAKEYAKYNITSNTVSPSFMLTGMNENVDSRIVDQLVAEHPLKRLLTPEEVAQSIAYLVSAPNHLNGTDLVLDGGQNMI